MKKEVLLGAAAYLMWGFFPIYFKALQTVPAVEIVGHRITWSFFLLLVLFVVTGGSGALRLLRANFKRRTVLIYLGAGALLSTNWLVYVWGVNAGRVVETSLGYFINPLVSILLGTIVLRERLRLTQWIPVGLAAVGVLYLTFVYGSFPWVALALALSFGFYGLVKKIAPLESLPGLIYETGAIFLPALGYLVFAAAQGSGAFIRAGLTTSLLLALTGVVTSVPLICFAISARAVPLTTLGLLQYLTPTIQFLIGVFIYREPFNAERVIGFCIIWVALILLSGETFLHRHRVAAARA